MAFFWQIGRMEEHDSRACGCAALLTGGGIHAVLHKKRNCSKKFVTIDNRVKSITVNAVNTVNKSTVNRIYFTRYFFSRMADQNFRERVFFAIGQKETENRKRQIPEKHPKYTKKGLNGPIINIDIFAISYFSQMEFKSRKSRKIVAREKYTVYSTGYSFFKHLKNFCPSN